MLKSLALLLLTLSATPAAAQIAGGSNQSLTQTSQVVQPLMPPYGPPIENAQSVTPLMDIGGLKAWTVVDATGQRTLALTTPDGLTIIGELYGPQGQNLSAALLGSSGERPLASAPTPGAPTAPAANALPSTDDNSITPLLGESPIAALPSQAPGTIATQSEAGISALTGGSPAPNNAPSETAEAAPAERDSAVTPIDNRLKANSVDDLLHQAKTMAVWFPAATAKPDAPVIYFLADPTCAHCARATEELAPQVRAGDIDLRVILSPILSRDAVYQAASMIQSDDPGRNFLDHELAHFSSSESPLTVLAPTDIDPDVVRRLQHNVTWARTNGVQGVPFWIYDTAEGAKVDFGAIKPEMLEEAIAIPDSPQEQAAQ